MSNYNLSFNRDAAEELSRRKSASMRIMRARREEIRKNFPSIEEIIRESSDIAFEFANRILEEPERTGELEALAKQFNESKNAELKAALLENGFPADYLETPYVCPICRDTGSVDGEMCKCIKKYLIEKSEAGSGLNRNERFESFRHDLFSDPNDRKKLDELYRYCVGYAESFPNNDIKDMLLFGAPGVGKSYLLNSIGCRVSERGYSVQRLTAHKLIESTLDVIRDYEAPRPDYVMPDLLIIDDLGTEPQIGNITLETLLSVISERQDEGKPTLFATNKDIIDIQEQYGSRIFSRLVSPRTVRVIEVDTPSIRMMKF